MQPLAQFTCRSLEETDAAAVRIAKLLAAGQSAGLSGALGSGKTTLVRYLCKALGLQVEVSSPTYVLQHIYPGTGGFQVEHWDLYRVNALPEELESDADRLTLRLIEWPERISGFVQHLHMLINIDFDAAFPHTRTISCIACS